MSEPLTGLINTQQQKEKEEEKEEALTALLPDDPESAIKSLQAE